MITVEYYWDSPHLTGHLATYTLKGDGSPGTATIEPFPDVPSYFDTRYYAQDYLDFYQTLSNWPEALMFLDLEADELHRAWTLDLVKEHCQSKLATTRAVIIEPGTPKGTSNPVERYVFGKCSVVPKDAQVEKPARAVP